MASQQYTNLAQSSFASPYTAGDSSITLQSGDGALFPATGDFTIAIDSPTQFFLKCTSRSGDVLTVNPSATEGTVAQSKAVGILVVQVLTAGTMDAIRSDLSQVGVNSGLPVSGMKKGDRYEATDAPYYYVFDGSVWDQFSKVNLVVSSHSSNYPITSTDNIVIATSTLTFTLPSTSGLTGKIYFIKNLTGSGSVTINTSSGATIDGQSSWIMSSQYSSMTVFTDGSNWFII
jgi:hypothetical protein